MAEEKVPEAGAAKAIVEMTAEARAHALHACRRILRPLVKILIRAGVRFDDHQHFRPKGIDPLPCRRTDQWRCQGRL